MQNITPEFKKKLISNIKNGLNLQNDQILTIQSKIFEYGLAIQEEINNIINNKELLLKNNASDAFLQNSCCNSKLINVNTYLINEKPIINTYNNIVIELDKMLNITKFLSKPSLLYDITNTKYKFPEVNSQFSKDTILKAFIVFCNSNTLKLSEDLKISCKLNHDSTIYDNDNDNDNDNIDTKVEQLKKNGIIYDETLMNKLLTIVNLKNSVNLDLTNVLPDKVMLYNKIIQTIKLDEHSNQYIPNKFTELFEKLLHRYSIQKYDLESQELRDLKNFISQNNDLISNKIDSFIKKHVKLNKSKYTSFIDCFNNISHFNGHQKNFNEMINFMNNSLKNISCIFPNIVINQNDYSTVTIPSHWKLSKRHNNDIKEDIENYYLNLKPFYKNKYLIPILNKIQTNVKNIILLAKNTPYFSPISNHEKEFESIFDKRLITLLFKYYFLLIIDNYITVFDNELPIRKVNEDSFDSSDSQEKLYDNPEQNLIDSSIVIGDKKEAGIVLSKYIINIIKIICNDKDQINIDKENIIDKTIKSKVKEKEQITDYLGGLNEDEREIENILKNQKLGRWGKGLTKGFRQYVGENYDQEREEMEKQDLKDKILNDKEGVDDENKNIYNLDLDEDDLIQEEIDAEVNNLSDYGGEDDNSEYTHYYDDDDNGY